MKSKTFVLFIFLPFFLFSQGNEKEKELILKGNLTSTIDVFSFPTIQLSLEKKLTDRFSLNGEIGYQLYDFRKVDTLFINPKGFKINIECRYYFSKHLTTISKNKLEGAYIGLQGFYRKNQYTAGISYCTTPDSTISKDDEFGVKKSIIGLNGIIGYQSSITTNIVVDMYAGLGMMNKTIKNTDIQFNSKAGDFIIGNDLVPLFSKLNLSESSGVSANITFGIRVGIRL